jgi:hypothetical protein
MIYSLMTCFWTISFHGNKIFNRLQYLYILWHDSFLYDLFLDPIISWKWNVKSTTIHVHHSLWFIHLWLVSGPYHFMEIEYWIDHNTCTPFRIIYSFMTCLLTLSFHGNKILNRLQYMYTICSDLFTYDLFVDPIISRK